MTTYVSSVIKFFMDHKNNDDGDDHKEAGMVTGAFKHMDCDGSAGISGPFTKD